MFGGTSGNVTFIVPPAAVYIVHHALPFFTPLVRIPVSAVVGTAAELGAGASTTLAATKLNNAAMKRPCPRM